MCSFHSLKLFLQSPAMFNGELESLKSIRRTRTVFAPRPIAIGRTDIDRHFLVMEYLNLTSLDDKQSAKLGSQLADMHLSNILHKDS